MAAVMAAIAMRPFMSSARGLAGQRRRRGRLGRRLARAPEAVAARPVAGLLPSLPLWAEPPNSLAGAPWAGAASALPRGHCGRAAQRQPHPPLLLVLDGAVLDGRLFRLELDQVVDDPERYGAALVDLLQ